MIKDRQGKSQKNTMSAKQLSQKLSWGLGGRPRKREPDISITPESSEQEKREAWEQINKRCHPMAEFLILVRKGFPKTNGTTVNVWFGGKK